MRKKFTESRQEAVTLHRGESEVLSFTVTALPPGYHAFLQRVYPPIQYERGKAADLDEGAAAERSDLLGYLVLAKGLEQDGCLESNPPPGSAALAAWKHYAIAVRQEFRDAQFTDGECNELLRRVFSLSGARDVQDVSAAAGNSAAPEGG